MAMPPCFVRARRLFDYTLTVAVQSFMLLQVGFFYALLHKRAANLRRLLLPKPAVPLPNARSLRTISIVVPVYNEAAVVGQCLRSLVAGAVDASRIEVVIVDAGCKDTTMEVVASVAAALALKVGTTTSSGGRGPALIAGIRETSGDAILTLHADTRLPEGWDVDILQGLSDPSVLMTAFSFGTDRTLLAEPEAPPAGLAFMEWTVNLRSRWYELPFGDQALAMRADELTACGGFPNVPILEEYILVNTLRAKCAAGGGRILTLPKPALCSPRRWEKANVWRINAVNQAVMIWYRFGATPEQVFEFYYGRKVGA